MKIKSTLDGHDLKAMFNAGTDWLEKIEADINALNVYPVPDGDTGTNMLLTMQASVKAANIVPDGSAAVVAQAIGKGSLVGARGNSGVILSQIWHGFARELKDREVIDARDLARALKGAADTAYRALNSPVEGTILTVIRDAATAAMQQVKEKHASSISVLEAAVDAARAAVINTPNLLSVLKDAGVVDAGGHGLFTLLHGALLQVKGEMTGRFPEVLSEQRPLMAAEAVELSGEDEFYGFCTQFMIEGRDLNVARLREALRPLGESLIVVGDGSTVRVHIHTRDTDAVTRLGATFGNVVDVDIRDMDEQHQDFLLMKRGRSNSLTTAVVAVINGYGMVNVFADLGVAAVVPGGQTMNPSTMDILRAVEKLEADNVIVLPNNKNVVHTALLVPSLTKKNLKVIPTKTIPQGVSALVEFLPEADFDTNLKNMTANAATVRTIEITRATRSAKVNGLEINQGQYIGLLDCKLRVACSTPEDAIFRLFDMVDLTKYHLLTLYFGKDTDRASAEQIKARICEQYPEIEAGVVDGGQPHYQYIISVE